MGWDASRVAAAIPSGVGFLGAGLIFKKEEKGVGGDNNHVVHGLTTAASLWLSAAVGIACGGDLYMPASFCVAIMLLLLRFGPRHAEEMDDGDYDEEDEEEGDQFFEDPQQTEMITKRTSTAGSTGGLADFLSSTTENAELYSGLPSYSSIHQNEETTSLRSSTLESGKASSFRPGNAQARRRNQAAFGSAV